MKPVRISGGPCWIVGAPSSVSKFFHALPDLLPPDSILVLEECAMVPELARIIAPHEIEPVLHIARQTIFPRSRQHHLRLADSLAQAIATAAGTFGPAAPQLCDHVSAYSGPNVLLEWHDAFLGDPMLVSFSLPDHRVRAFAARLGVTVELGTF